MKKVNLEHIIRAAGDIAEENEFYVVGSQAIFGQYPNLESMLLQLKNEGKINDRDIINLIGSQEADIIPIRDETKADLISGVIGELSPYHETHGYYADGVDSNTAKLPYGFQSRLHKISNDNTRWVTAYCIDIHDLIAAKLFAGREKDIEYVRSLIKIGLVDEQIVHERLNQIQIDSIEADKISIAHARIQKIFDELKK
jgi:hypothetical protein